MHDEQKTTASHELGLDECARLRTRVHGRDLSDDEIFRRVWPYLLRHLLAHARHRFVDLLPAERVPVPTIPDESWLVAAAGKPAHV